MSTYSAINIGPITKTIMMARKPRDLWAASYMFSYLMKCIISVLPKDNIISPCVSENTRKDIGLYPDRIYLNCDIDENVVRNAVKECADYLGVDEKYFNITIKTLNDCSSYSDAIKKFNKQFDIEELYVKAVPGIFDKNMQEMLLGEKSRLFTEAYNDEKHSIHDLATISSNGVKNSEFSYAKYFCIVQADGDEMGRIISNAKDEKVQEISKALLKFGEKAIECIENYSSKNLPLYAGGDDLLFIVPVVGNKKNIFELISDIDNQYNNMVKIVADTDKRKTTLSYGISISYHKYPLYEALGTARYLLEKVAKKVDGKNAIAWDLRKHSGGAFTGSFSKSNEVLYEAFKKIIDESINKDSIVSAVAHKIKDNERLINLWLKKEEPYRDRNSYFFEKFMDGIDDKGYKEAVLGLLNEMFTEAIDKNMSIEEVVKTMYAMLRTAKFVKGESNNE